MIGKSVEYSCGCIINADNVYTQVCDTHRNDIDDKGIAYDRYQPKQDEKEPAEIEVDKLDIIIEELRAMRKTLELIETRMQNGWKQ